MTRWWWNSCYDQGFGEQVHIVGWRKDIDLWFVVEFTSFEFHQIHKRLCRPSIHRRIGLCIVGDCWFIVCFSIWAIVLHARLMLSHTSRMIDIEKWHLLNSHFRFTLFRCQHGYKTYFPVASELFFSNECWKAFSTDFGHLDKGQSVSAIPLVFCLDHDSLRNVE